MTADDLEVSVPENAIHVGAVAEFDDGDRIIVDAQGREIAVFRVNGEFHAVANYCVHQGGPVCEGLLSGTVDVDTEGNLVYDRDGQVISCPWHGWEFDITNGVHLSDSSYKLPTYDTVIDSDEVYVVP